MAARRFLTELPSESPTSAQSSASAIAISILLHGVLLAALAVTVFRTAVEERSQERPAISARLVYSQEAGGGSSKQGGEKTVEPPRMAQVVGTRPLVVAAARPTPQPQTTPSEIVPDPLPTISTVAPLGDVGVREAVGTLAQASPDGSSGAGDGARSGSGDRGQGCCGGRGDRDGAGDDGDGVQPGKGVSWPRLLQEVKPNYTADAMRAQIEGLVELDIVVLPDGSVGRVNIRRSLDSRFGLDTEAIKAVRLWRFDPARRAGKAVAARVGVELSFNLR
jgi:periplasmic protein TonB